MCGASDEPQCQGTQAGTNTTNQASFYTPPASRGRRKLLPVRENNPTTTRAIDALLPKELYTVVLTRGFA